MASLLFYQNPVGLNKDTHKDLKIDPSQSSFDFAKKTNSVVIAGVEFTEAAKEYPIVFAEAGDSWVPVVLLGLRNEENLFVKDDGGWDCKYVPAFVRRYPFVLAEGGEKDQQVVCIDEAYVGFNRETGDALFKEDGEATEFLSKAINFLEEYQRQYARTELFIKRLKEYDLLISLNAQIDMTSGQKFALSGLLVVDEKKLLALEDEKALDMFRSGELAWIYCHLMSMGNMNRLVERMGKLLPQNTSEASA